jgi:hypothetical protein
MWFMEDLASISKIGLPRRSRYSNTIELDPAAKPKPGLDWTPFPGRGGFANVM